MSYLFHRLGFCPLSIHLKDLGRKWASTYHIVSPRWRRCFFHCLVLFYFCKVCTLHQNVWLETLFFQRKSTTYYYARKLPTQHQINSYFAKMICKFLKNLIRHYACSRHLGYTYCIMSLYFCPHIICRHSSMYLI